MNLGQRLKKKSESFEVFATAGTIGLHMVTGPLVGFGMGYGLDILLDTSPWMKLVFLLIGIGAGFLNVYRDTQSLLRKMQKTKGKTPTQAEDLTLHKDNKNSTGEATDDIPSQK